MRMLRFIAPLLLLLVLVACGRRLPEAYFDTDTDVVADVAEEENNPSPETDENTADDDTETVDVVETDDTEVDEVAVAEADDAEVDDPTSDDVVTEVTDDEAEEDVAVTEAEPQFELVEVPADPIVEQVANADPINGEALLNASVPCSSCHAFDSEVSMVGPGLLNLPIRAEARVDGEVAERYLYNSILHPNDFIVDSYPEGVMPAIYADLFTEEEILDLVAYLMTLGDYPEREPIFIEVPVESSSDNMTTETAADETQSTDDSDMADDQAETETADASSTETTDIELVEQSELDLSAVPTTIDFLVENGSIIQGEALFNAELVAGMSCSTCHLSDDLSDIVTSQPLPAYLWASIFTEQTHPDLGIQYVDEITGAQASHLVAYLVSLNQVEDE